MGDRFFLDANAWNYLCDPSRLGESVPTDLRQRLRSAVGTGRLAVLSSVAVLEELMGAARSQRAKYAEMYDLIFGAVGSRWLLPLDERAVKEAFHGGVLPDALRYLPRSTRRQMRTEAARREAVDLVADQVHDQVRMFRREQHDIREKLRMDLGPEGATSFQDRVRRWWDHEVDVQSWVSDLVHGSINQGRAPPGASSDKARRQHGASYPTNSPGSGST